MRYVRRKLVQTSATRLLRLQTKQKAPVNVVEIAKALDLQIVYKRTDKGYSGFLYRKPNGSVLIGVNVAHGRERQRFTIAHEIGHFLLHSDDLFHVDSTSVGFMMMRDRKSSEGIDINEREANLFAAELLMPKRYLEDYLSELSLTSLHDEAIVDNLSKSFQVSNEAMAYRLQYLQLEFPG